MIMGFAMFLVLISSWSLCGKVILQILHALKVWSWISFAIEMSFVYDICASYLFMKRGSLFCFVCHVEISQTTALHAMLLVSLESSQWVGVHWLGLRLFGAMVWKLLIIESFSQWKLNKIAIENFIRIGFYSKNSTHSETIWVRPGLCPRRHWNCFSNSWTTATILCYFCGVVECMC
jgi:hypothetical protein